MKKSRKHSPVILWGLFVVLMAVMVGLAVKQNKIPGNTTNAPNYTINGEAYYTIVRVKTEHTDVVREYIWTYNITPKIGDEVLLCYYDRDQDLALRLTQDEASKLGLYVAVIKARIVEILKAPVK